jgi:very-short-patch-repair endonuclease
VPARQVAITVAGQAYRLDLAYVAEKVAIEIDGYGTHRLRSAFETDRERQNPPMLHGWLILRFTWRQIRRDPEGVAFQLRQALALRAAA